MSLTDHTMRLRLASEDAHEHCLPGQTTNASINCDTVYLDNMVTVYPNLMHIWDGGDLEEAACVILHEMIHIWLAPVQDEALVGVGKDKSDLLHNIIERQVERICKSFSYVLPNGWWEPSVVSKWYEASIALGSIALEGDSLAKKKKKESKEKHKKGCK
jgi:hypothetical protein